MQLYYKKGRRYYEFYPPLHPSELVYYQDAEGNYIPLSSETARWFFGYPKEGFWSVKPSSRSWIGEFKINANRLGLEKYRDNILSAIDKALQESEGKYLSRNDIATYILENLALLDLIEAGTFDENAVLFYVNWFYDRTGNYPNEEQIESFKKDDLKSIEIYVKKGYSLKDAFSKIVTGRNR